MTPAGQDGLVAEGMVRRAADAMAEAHAERGYPIDGDWMLDARAALAAVADDLRKEGRRECAAELTTALARRRDEGLLAPAGPTGSPRYWWERGMGDAQEVADVLADSWDPR